MPHNITRVTVYSVSLGPSPFGLLCHFIFLFYTGAKDALIIIIFTANTKL